MEHSYSSANKDHFNSAEVGRKYDEQPLHAEMARRIGKALLKAYTFDDDHTTVLDFACGTGLNSRFLAPYTKSIVGADISQEMVNRYNESVRNQGIVEEEMRAVCIPEELLHSGSNRNLEIKQLLGGTMFDVVICCMSYHHFPSISSITHTLSSLLKFGGHLFVADVESIPRSSSLSSEADDPVGRFEPIFSDGVCDAGIVVHKYGFSEQEIGKVFAEAGMEKTTFKFEIIAHASKNGKPVKIFLANAVKPG